MRSNIGGREDAEAHWKRVLTTSGLPSISYQYAKEALDKLGSQPDRVVGEDDE